MLFKFQWETEELVQYLDFIPGFDSISPLVIIQKFMVVMFEIIVYEILKENMCPKYILMKYTFSPKIMKTH